MALSKTLIKFASVNLTIFRLFPASICLIHLFACSWGSIISGHLPACVTMMAFSVETASRGRPHVFHVRISYGSAKTPIKLKCSNMFLWGTVIVQNNFDYQNIHKRISLCYVMRLAKLGCLHHYDADEFSRWFYEWKFETKSAIIPIVPLLLVQLQFIITT